MYDIEIIKKINKTDPELARLMLSSREGSRPSSTKPLAKIRAFNCVRNVANACEGVCEVLFKSLMFGAAVYVVITLCGG
jgi:hypothetical protein